MDAAILRALIEKAVKLDEKLKVQSTLELARDAMSNMASAPHDPGHQTAFAQAFKTLKSAILRINEELTPGDWDRLNEISSVEYFSTEFVDNLSKLVADNPATPAVIRDELVNLSQTRQNHLTQMRTLLKSLRIFGFENEPNDSSEGQIGFKIPRDIFSNNLSGLLHELNFLRKLIRLVAETKGENPDEIEVGTISTTDPVFWFIVAYGVSLQVGKITHWALDTWKKVEDIRHVRAQTAQIQSFTSDEIEKIFGPKIEEQIKLAVEEQSKTLTNEVDDLGRRNEIENGFRPILRQFLARVERGLTVDIRYLPPPVGETENDEDEALEKENEQRSEEIKVLASYLVFRRPVGEPVLLLEAANDDSEQPPKP